MKQQYKLVPPEGGFGYIICLGMSLPFIHIIGAMGSFALIFGDFFAQLGEETSSLTLVTSTYFCSLSISGLFANVLFSKFGLRKVALVAGVTYFVGSLCTVFVRSTWQLVITFGIFQGTAAGWIVPATYTVFNSYFIEKRVTMLSLTKSFIGLGTMVYPMVVQKIYGYYGFRGCLLILAAMNGNAILGMLMLHPVEWHMKKVPITEEEAEKVEANGHHTEKEKQDEDHHQLEPLMEDKNGGDGGVWSRRSSMLRRSHRSLTPKLTQSRRASSIASLGNWAGPIVVSDVSECKPPKQGKWNSLIESLDLPLLKDPIYMNIILGTTFALYSDVAFFTLQPMYLFQLKYSKADVAAIIAIGSAADLGSRLLLAAGSTVCKVPPRCIYLIAAIITIGVRFVILEVREFTAMAIMTAIMGLLRTYLHVPIPLIFAEYLPTERFAAGYGLFMFLHGIIMFGIGPVIGYIRDKTQNYIFTFHILTVIMAFCAIPWTIEVIYMKYFKKADVTDEVNKPAVEKNGGKS